MPNSFRIPEGGPVDVMDSDEALLATKPTPKDYDDSESVVLDIPETKPLPIQQVVEFIRTLPDRAMEYAVKHPATTSYVLGTGWGAGLADAIAPLDTYTRKVGVRLGSPFELLEHLDEHPEDWLHLIPGQTKLQDMIENPEDYAE